MPSGSSSAAYSSAMGSQCHWTDRHCSQLWCHIVHCRHHGPGASRVKGLVEIPWRNNEKHHKFHRTSLLDYSSCILLSFSIIHKFQSKKKSQQQSSVLSPPSANIPNHHPTISYQESIHRHQVTILGCVPSSLEALQPSEVPRIRWIFTWGEGMPAALAQRWRSGDGVRLVELLISNLVKNKEGVRIQLQHYIFT